MNKNTISFMLALLLSCTLLTPLLSCSGTAPEMQSEDLKYEYIGDEEPPPIEDFIQTTIVEMSSDPELYAGTFVIVSGKIVNLCPVGCYFFMHDEEGNQVYVDLAPQNFDVPQSALGEQVEVWGLGSMSGGAPKVSAYKVIFPNIDQQNIDTQSLDRIPEKSIIDENTTFDR